MVDRAVAATKLAAIRDAAARVRDVLPADPADFAADRDAREIVALNLLVAIQEAIDLAAHAIADAGRVVPGTYRELFKDLADHGVLEPSLAEAMAAASGLRNRLAHQYGTVDWHRVHEAAAAGSADLDRFCAVIAARLTGK